MIQFADVVADVLAAETEDFSQRDPGTFFASHVGFCLRHLYLSKLGLTVQAERRGQYKVSRLIQSYLEDCVSDRHPRLEVGASVQFSDGPLQFVGRCNLFDADAGIAYALKTRNGWYKFTPPIQRHLDQLHIYMQGLGVERGQLVYVSNNDIDDLCVWPATDTETDYVTFNQERFESLVTKAQQIRDAIVKQGIATEPAEIPFQRCGCYFCENEQLSFPTTTGEPRQQTAAGSTTTTTTQTQNSRNTSQSSSGGSTDHDSAIHPSEVDDRDSMPRLTPDTSPTLHTDEMHVPVELRELQLWVVWDGRSKIALAPWQEGTMYPCEWANSKPVNPRRPFQKARMVTELPVHAIHQAWPFPNENDLPSAVLPAILLPHDPPAPPVTVVDLDDVRDPDTGHVSAEAKQIVDLLNGYAELSASGTGLHVYGRGALPDNAGPFHASLADRGTIEIYDRSRFIASTWRHVTDTPRNRIPNVQNEITALVTRYTT